MKYKNYHLPTVRRHKTDLTFHHAARHAASPPETLSCFRHRTRSPRRADAPALALWLTKQWSWPSECGRSRKAPRVPVGFCHDTILLAASPKRVEAIPRPPRGSAGGYYLPRETVDAWKGDSCGASRAPAGWSEQEPGVGGAANRNAKCEMRSARCEMRGEKLQRGRYQDVFFSWL